MRASSKAKTPHKQKLKDAVKEAPAGSGIRLTAAALLEAANQDGNSEFSLDLHGRSISAVDGLDTFTKLRCLDLSFNCMESIRGLDGLRQLKELKLYRNHLTACDSLQELRTLEHLHLQGNRIRDIPADFLQLRSLTFLRLDGNDIWQVEHLDRLGNLTYLDLSNNRIKEAQGFRHLRSLETLLLNSNELTTLGDIPTCASLQSLSIERNGITSLKGLPSLASLSELRCGYNDRLPLLLDDTAASVMHSLAELYAPAIGLSSLACLRSFPNVYVLDVSDNALTSVTALSDLAPLSSLSDLTIQGNPAAAMPECTQVLISVAPALEFLNGSPFDKLTVAPALSRPGSASAWRRPCTPVAGGMGDRPGSASTARPMSARSMRPATPGSDAAGTQPRTPRPTMKTALSRAAPTMHVTPNEELQSTLSSAMSKLHGLRSALADFMGKKGLPVPAHPPPPLPITRTPAQPSATPLPSSKSSAGAASDVSIPLTRPPSGLKAAVKSKPTAEPSAASRPARVLTSAAKDKQSPAGQRLISSSPISSIVDLSPMASPLLVPTVSDASMPVFIKSTRRRNSSTGKLLPLPTEPPPIAVDAAHDGAAAAGLGPQVRPSSAAADPSLRLRLPTASGVTLSAGGSVTQRSMRLVPESVVTSPRYTSDRTAELRGRPSARERQGFTRFTVPERVKQGLRLGVIALPTTGPASDSPRSVPS